MVIGFVLINTVPANKDEVHNKLLEVAEIIELHLLHGEYDLLAKVQADDLEKIGDVVIKKIRAVNGIIDTRTLTGGGIKFQ